jgi:uncharacterized SAM-binding protein YcdF (DUF218 family)
MSEPPGEARAAAAPKLRRMRRTGFAGTLLALAILAWLGGLVWFAEEIPSEVADPTTVTDALVVLTGGSERLEAGLALLAEGKAQKLFVSGVYRGVEVQALLRLARKGAANLECCIVLGHSADSTRGNARETAAWMASEHRRSLRLITGAYHMPRSLLEFRRAMPEIAIIPNPVFPERVKEDWWRWPGTAMLIVEEYDKYLVTLLRLAPDPSGQEG